MYVHGELQKITNPLKTKRVGNNYRIAQKKKFIALRNTSLLLFGSFLYVYTNMHHYFQIFNTNQLTK